MPATTTFPAPIAEEIWRSKYRWHRPDGTAEASLAETLERVAGAAAAAEKGGKRAQARWKGKFAEALSDLGFLPAGRILAGAGTGRDVTLFNCFVMGTIPDDLGGIFDSVKEAALTMQAGGGVGMDFSTLRPKGALVRSIGADASGPVGFMEVWDAMCRTIMSAGARRGAMMATMRADHPDIEAFIDAKSVSGRLNNFNLSVLVTDAFLAAVRADADWDLAFGGKVYRTIRARKLWRRIMRATYDYAEPGVIFIDRINAANNLAYCETIQATNPCGEQPLPPFGACLLGSINLAAIVNNPFGASAGIDTAALEERVATAVRFLDNIIDVSRYPLPQQQREAKAKRRIGLGITGLADALIFLGLRYDSAEGRDMAESWMHTIQTSAYRASAELAAEKGAFPLYDRDAIAPAPNVAKLDKDTRGLIARHGLRNGCLTSIAPTGTISLLAGNVSSGIEPVFDFSYRRHVLGPDGVRHEETVEDYAHAVLRQRVGEDAVPDPAFVRATDIAPQAHLEMQAAIQRHVDSSISKTINLPADIPFEAFEAVYLQADALGLKGCTTYRPNAVTGAVLETAAAPVCGETCDSGAGSADAPPAPQAGLDGDSTPADQPDPQAAPRLPHELVPSPASPDVRPAHRASQMTTAGDVVYMARPLEREPVLAGYTYKLKWPASDHAIYVTINDIEVNGRRRPFEIFINTRNLEHYAWTVALTRMISAVFRRGGDVTFVAQELKAVFDPQGGQWMGGRYVPSLLAAIGDVIERHMVEIGFLGERSAALEYPSESDVEIEALLRTPDGGAAAERGADGRRLAAAPQTTNSKNAPATSGDEDATRAARVTPTRFCPRCSSPHVELREGCWVCRDCGFSKCG
ncbi:MAG: adenosylcobalamin-dependent ribonucleoside-diphosphate reductase [Hyphomicrobiaceae bacterium]|nr:adenosylcobalamin-dependent ribonucleoside-diphosphate reductase [Hyphomicrobiaceae bacterium]